MGQPKRVWSNKKTVWDGKKSVWLQDGELKTYDGNWEDAGSDLQTYGSEWEEVSDDAILDVYDSNTPEPIGTPEDGIKATYTFKDYDGTVLKTGTVDDGGTPVAPTDPTREATAQYTYTFAGWSPAVGPIAKNTVYTATYTSTVNTYIVNISANDDNYGTLSQASVTGVPYGTSISASDNVLTIGETTVTATAESGYVFSSWGTLPATVTENLNITATFEAVAPVLELCNSVNITELGYGDEGDVRANLFQLGSGEENDLPEGTNYIEKTDYQGYSTVGSASYLDWLYTGITYCKDELENAFDAILSDISNIPNFSGDYTLNRNFNVFFSHGAWEAIKTYMAAEGVETSRTARTALKQALGGLNEPIFCGNTYGYAGLPDAASYPYVPRGVVYDANAQRVSFCTSDDNSGYISVEIHDGEPVLMEYDNSVGAIMKSILDGTWGGSQADIETYRTNLKSALQVIYNDAVTALGNSGTPGEFTTAQDSGLIGLIRQMYSLVSASLVNTFAMSVNLLSSGGTSVVEATQS